MIQCVSAGSFPFAPPDRSGQQKWSQKWQTSQDGHFNEEHDGQTDSNIECWNSKQLPMICLDC